MQIKNISTRLTLALLCIIIAISAVDAKNKKRSSAKTSSKAKRELVEKKIGIEIPKDSTNQKLTSLYNEAMDWLKTPYRRGGMSSRGMDCSGLTGTIYKNVFGVTLQRSSNDISRIDVNDVSKNELRPGDLVFFSTSRRGKRVNHVGVFLGNRHFIHASTSNGVIISSLDEAYYQRTWVKGGRVKSATEKTSSEEIPTT
ncbi:C40 family peptidase [Dysgonomonas capnocytophagoides]|uniref:C40 family peptidase n=1 Tax=Dysgonomonas capnocytophagoides TaxID=45254 RepID=UPI00333E356C